MGVTTRGRSRAPDQVEVECITAPTYRGGRGLILINGAFYLLTCHGPTSRDGFRLVRATDPAKVYDLDTSSGAPVCDCPDANYRQRQCKHSFALSWLRNHRHI